MVHAGGGPGAGEAGRGGVVSFHRSQLAEGYRYDPDAPWPAEAPFEKPYELPPLGRYNAEPGRNSRQIGGCPHAAVRATPPKNEMTETYSYLEELRFRRCVHIIMLGTETRVPGAPKNDCLRTLHDIRLCLRDCVFLDLT